MEKFQRYLEKYQFRQQKCLYPLLFQEYIYAFAYYYGLKVPIEPVKKLTSYDNKSSLILVKRLIIRMYQPNYFMNSAVPNLQKNQKNENNCFFCTHFFSQMISEGFGVVVEIPFSLQFQFSSSQTKKEIPNLQNLRSIHSIFSFLEDKYTYFNDVLDILIPYPIHFEILIQILQCWIQDIPSLHFLRFFLLNYYNWNSFIISKNSFSIFSKENRRLSRFLYNSYVSEHEFLFLFICKQSSCLRLTSFEIFLERIYFYGKIEHFRIVYHTFLQRTLWSFMNPLLHYVRYQGKAILASKGTDLFIFMEKWKSYLFCLWQYYFHFWSEPNRFSRNPLDYYSFDFLGYSSSVKRNHLLVRCQILEDSIFIDILMKRFDTIVPVIPLIRSLSKASLCTVLGHPTSKPIWTDLSDCDIISRFGRIWKNLFHFYSGSSKKIILYRMKYILRLSCARTLARKHKSTVRILLQNLGSIFLEEFFTEEEQVLSLVFQKTIHFSFHRSKKERIWYFDITHIDGLINNET